MNERSTIWKKKKGQLELEEDRIKGELEEMTDDFAYKAKTVLKISLITGGVFLAGYGLYKIFSPNKEQPAMEPVLKKVPQVKEKEGFSFKNMLFERLAIALVSFIGAKLTTFLSKNFGEEEGDED